jgi:hypothetical protein
MQSLLFENLIAHSPFTQKGQASVRSTADRISLIARRHKRKKADVVEHTEVFDHVGLLVNEPPGVAGLPFI